MENPIYIGLSRQVALRANMDIVANNVANMSTPGYRAQNMVFTEYLSKPKGMDDSMSMVLDYGHFQVTEEGPMRRTTNPLDVALNGPGFFGIQTAEGIMYSRAGNFQLNNNGELVTGAGYQVAGAGGGPIIIPPEATEIKITADGTITTDQGQVGQLLVAEFPNIQELKARGNGLYFSENPGIAPAENTQVMQGMLEGSNVKPVLEMTRMIDVLRAYQATQKMLESEHERLRSMAQRLTGSG